MSLRFHHFAPNTRAHRAIAIPCAALITAITMLSACGSPGSAKLSSTTTPNSANLSLSANLPNATEGSTYNGSVTATGGKTPYYYAIISGQLPQGVNLDHANGNVSGTPSAAGNFSFNVSVADASGNYKQQGLQINVTQQAATSQPAPSSPPPSTPPPSNPPASNPPASNPPASNPPASNPPASNPAPSSGSSGKALSNLQASGGWGQYGQGPPSFVDCSPSPCDGIEFSMTQGVNSPSLSGNATVYWLGGSTAYSDALWNNHLIGMYSSQGLSDGDGSLTPSISNFQYDVDFYGDNLNSAQALEFDINQFFDSMGFIFGHECRVAGGNQWDIWDNSKGQWIPTGIPCYPKSGQWNHLTLKVQRTSDNHETYQSITLNGQTANLGWTFNKGSSPGWYGVTVNFQLDGDSKQDSYKVYLDNLTLTYQ